MSADDEIDAEMNELDIEDEISDLASTLSGRLHQREPAIDTVAWNSLQVSLTAEHKRRLRRPGTVAVVIEVPGPGWVKPIADAVVGYGPWDLVDARDGSESRQHRPDRGNDTVARMLSRGGRCVGISPTPLRHLPAALTGTADLWIKVTPSDRAVSDTILAATGRRPRDLPSGACIGLDPYDIGAAIRVGDTAGTAVARLRAAVERRTIVDNDVASAPPFASLHGYGAAKIWGDALIVDLADWRQGRVSFDAISSRAVLASPPGLGKSTFVRSLARAAGVPLIATSVSQWFASSPGNLDSVVKAVDEVFNAARAFSPSLIFLDEIDAIPNRIHLDSRNRDWWIPVITHILLTLDSAVSGANSKTIVIGATNHVAHLDEALIRPGRLDTILKIGYPDAEARVGILRAHLHGDLDGEDLGPVAAMAVGMTGADLADVVKKARRVARVCGRALTLADLAQTVAPADTRRPEERRVAAIHEAGHVVGRLEFGYAVTSVSIIERGDSGGVTIGTGPSSVVNQQGIEDYVVALLCGRAAEQELIGSATTGAGGGPDSDLAKAAAWTASIHTSYGLGDGLLWRGPPPDAARLASLDPALRAQVAADLKRLFARALDLVNLRRTAIEAIAMHLLKDRHLSGDDIGRIFATTERSTSPSLKAAVGGRQ